MAQNWRYSSRKAKKELGYRTRPLERTLGSTIEWYTRADRRRARSAAAGMSALSIGAAGMRGAERLGLAAGLQGCRALRGPPARGGPVTQRFFPRDEYFMKLALREAERAIEHDDVPVGCVIAHEGEVLAAAPNERELREDPTAHCEVLAHPRGGAAARLVATRAGTVLYVTLEPCAMCAGAIVLARIPRVVYGAADPKAGAAGSVLDVLGEQRLNHRPEVAGGLLAEDSAGILREFFLPAADRTGAHRPRVELGVARPLELEERVHELGVEVACRAARSISASASPSGHASLVGALREERVEDVADRADAPGERDLLAAQAAPGSRCRPSARGG